MLWSVLTKTIGTFIKTKPNNAGSQTIAALAKEAGKEIDDYLASTDVREAGNLRKIIPEAFPRVIRTGGLKIDQNIHGAWRVKSASRPK